MKESENKNIGTTDPDENEEASKSFYYLEIDTSSHPVQKVTGLMKITIIRITVVQDGQRDKTRSRSFRCPVSRIRKTRRRNEKFTSWYPFWN